MIKTLGMGNLNRSETRCRLVHSIMSSTMSRQSKKSYFGIIDFGSSAPEATLLHDRKDGSCDSDDQVRVLMWQLFALVT